MWEMFQKWYKRRLTATSKWHQQVSYIFHVIAKNTTRRELKDLWQATKTVGTSIIQSVILGNCPALHNTTVFNKSIIGFEA